MKPMSSLFLCLLISPCPWLVPLFARVNVIHGLAASAAHVAAPDELALAAFHMTHHMCVVSTATAQQVAAVRPGRCAVTAAPPSPGHAQPPVLHAIIGRLVEEDELLPANGHVPLFLFFATELALGAV